MLKKKLPSSAEFSNNISLLIFFSLRQLYKFYAFLGYHRSTTDVLNNYYLIGYYSNMAIINLYKMLSIFKTNFSILFKVLIYKYGSFLVINENINKILSFTYSKRFIYGNISHFFGN
jgi:hypothetical protein